MKVTFNTATLRRLLAPVTAVVKKNNPSPILGGVHIQTGNDPLSPEAIFVATDLDRTVQSIIPIAQIERTGECVVDALLMNSLLSNCESETVTLDVNEAGKATLTMGKSKYTLPTHPAGDFPPDVTPQDGEWQQLPWKQVRDAIAKAQVAVELPKGGSARAVDGVRLESTETGIMVAGTNASSRTVLIDIPDYIATPFSGTLPAEAVADVLSLFQGEVEMLANGKLFAFRDGNVTYTSRLFADGYPPVRMVHDRAVFPHRVALNKANLRTALRRIGLVVNEGDGKVLPPPCVVTFSPDGNLHLTAENSSSAMEAHETLPLNYSG